MRAWELRLQSQSNSTEVQTTPTLASGAQLLACGIHTLVALTATKYVIMTDVPPAVVLEAFLQTMQ